MRCTRLVDRIFIVLFLSAMTFEIFALEEQELKPLKRRNILDDLWSLLGLGSKQSPSTDTNINTTTTSNSTSSTNDTITKDNNSTSDKNETYTANTNTNITRITNLTDNGINSSISVGNNNTNSEITVSGNNSLTSDNSTVISVNESKSFTNDTNENISEISIGEANNTNISTSVSPPPLKQDLVTLHNKTMHESLVQQNQTASNQSFPMASNSTVNQTEHNLPSEPQVSNDSSSANCSVLPNFSNTCQLPNDYMNQSDSLTTFADVEKTISDLYIQSFLLKYCVSGEWCLGNAMDSMINESLNVSSKFCSSTFLKCLRSTEADYFSCANYKKFKTISDSLELICRYKELVDYKQSLRTCGFHMVKLISVTLADLKRNDSYITNGEYFCYSQKGFLMISFNCLLTQCPEVFSTALTGFESWKWFTENRTEALQCQTDAECTWSTTLPERSSTGYTHYQLGDITARTSLDIGMTTEINWTKNKGAVEVPKGQNEKQSEGKYPPSGVFGDNISGNSHVMASLSAMMVILMIGMSVIMIVCWRHWKKNSSRKRTGYARLKTGEC